MKMCFHLSFTVSVVIEPHLPELCWRCWCECVSVLYGVYCVVCAVLFASGGPAKGTLFIPMALADPGFDNATGLPTPGNTATVHFRAPLRPRVDEVSPRL
jgi:hypothetical protein